LSYEKIYFIVLSINKIIIMATKDKRVDAYIAKAAGFAKPVLNYIREVVHKACPEAEETMKWSFPHFDYKGMLCSMAAFKQHCAFGFWKASLMSEANQLKAKNGEAMGHMGQITNLSDLPTEKKFIAMIKEAMRLNDEGVKLPPKKKAAPGPVEVPDYVTSALKKNMKAYVSFEAFSPSHRREYVQWITEAKSEETRLKRLGTAIEWLAEGKSRNWKYER
jgi:uncharacterized protein YdeI (YjbR/CyaY-like superfamily)